MLGSIGDLVEDVVVRLDGPIHEASDTHVVVTRRRGGSAANVVAAARRAGGAARFIGQVGDDVTGQWLTQQLYDIGADVAVRRAGRSGTIVVLVDSAGERTMLSDRATCVDLADPQREWLAGLHTLHIPLYSMAGGALAETTRILAGWARAGGVTVSVDTSSATMLTEIGVEAAMTLISELRPDVVLANELEAAVLGAALTPDRLGGALTIVKRGGGPATVLRAGQTPVDVAAKPLQHVHDTTGAGDAFAAGFLLAYADGTDAVEAVHRAHDVAAAVLTTDSAR